MNEDVTGCVLAGGQGQRMGGRDKGLIDLAGRPMAAHVIDRLAPQVAKIIISANRELEAYRALGCEVVTDRAGEFLGPLAGIDAAFAATETPYLAVVPCDAPFIPETLVARLLAALKGERAEVAVVHDGERRQYAFLLIDRACRATIAAYLEDGGRSIEGWLAARRVAVVDFASERECFANINTPGELQAAQGRGAMRDRS